MASVASVVCKRLWEENQSGKMGVLYRISLEA